MTKPIRTAVTAAALALALAGVSMNALADTQWQKDHPRREQVNNRLANQNKRDGLTLGEWLRCRRKLVKRSGLATFTTHRSTEVSFPHASSPAARRVAPP